MEKIGRDNINNSKRGNGEVLVAAPSSDRHFPVINKYLKALERQTYKDFDILIVDNSKDPAYSKYLARKGVEVIRAEWDSNKEHILTYLARAREIYRKYALENGYKYIMHLDTDIILPEDGLERLINFNKDNVGYVVHVYHGKYKTPCVFREGGFKLNQPNPRNNGLQYYSWSWYYRNRGKLKRVYATALGCLLSKRKVFKEVPFRSHPTFIYGEDLWFHEEANQKGFEFWCCVERIPHLNTIWDPIIETSKNKGSIIYFAFGHEEARNVVMV